MLLTSTKVNIVQKHNETPATTITIEREREKERMSMSIRNLSFSVNFIITLNKNGGALEPRS